MLSQPALVVKRDTLFEQRFRIFLKLTHRASIVLRSLCLRIAAFPQNDAIVDWSQIVQRLYEILIDSSAAPQTAPPGL